MNPVDPNLNSSSNSNEVGGMFSNGGDASRVDRSTEGGIRPISPIRQVGGTFSNTSDAPSQYGRTEGSGGQVSGMFSNSGDAPSQTEGSGGQVGGMFSNSGDAPSRAPVNPNRQNAEAGMFSNSSDSATSDAYGGAQREQGMGPMDPNLGDGEGNHEGESGGKKKHGILGKIKDAFVPKPGAPGRVQNEDLTRDDATKFQPGTDSGRHEQANRDLNRE